MKHPPTYIAASNSNSREVAGVVGATAKNTSIYQDDPKPEEIMVKVEQIAWSHICSLGTSAKFSPSALTT